MFDYSSLFKAYDVRGTFPDINEKIYYWIGYALVEVVLKPENLPLNINLLRDCRYTSPLFYKSFAAGFSSAGGKVTALGLGSTDFMYAACQILGNSGAMITASHNPKDDNGVKIVKKIPDMLGLTSGLDKVRDFVLSHLDQEIPEMNDLPDLVDDLDSKNKVLDFYTEKLLQIGQIQKVDQLLKEQNKTLKIVIDCANGMGGFVMPIVQKLYQNIEFVPLFWDLDGQFPNHPADPLVAENMQDTVRKVQEIQADLGASFDGDADRLNFVDENGEIVDGNFLVSAFAQSLLQDYFAHQNEKKSDLNPMIVYSQPNGRCIPYTVLENDGICVPSKQGHTNIKAKMSKFKALYGGERSGHHYFGEFAYMDCGALALVTFIKMLAQTGTKPSQFFVNLRQTYFFSPEINYKLGDNLTFDLIKEKIQTHFVGGNISYLDGITVFYPDWKLNIRASGTEPLIRLSIECIGENRVQEKVELVERVLF